MSGRLSVILDTSDRRRLAELFVLTLFGGVFETLGVGIIFPYLAFVNDPTLLQRTPLGNLVTGVPTGALVVAVSLAFVAFFIVKNGYVIWLQSRQLVFSNAKQVSLMHRLLESYFRRPYELQTEQHSALVIRDLTVSASEVCNGVILTGLGLATDVFSTAGILLTLLLVNPATTLTAGGMTIFAGWLLYRILRGRIALYSTRLHDLFGSLIKQVGEAAGAVKELQILGVEGYFLDRFGTSALQYTDALKRFHILNSMPRAFMEVLLAAVLSSAIVLLITVGEGLTSALPMLGVYAIAAVRIFPMVTRVSNSLNTMQKSAPALDTVVASLEGDSARQGAGQVGSETGPPLTFRETVRVEQIAFRYRSQPTNLFQNFSLEIRRGDRLALIGRSGSGKSTLLDILLGLLEPSTGRILVDGIDIRSNLRSWRAGIGYIPQHIYLLDDSVRRNVALGVDDALIDDALVWRALEQAEMADAVRSLPQGLDTRVGERGGFLSGGQRQRIGIARALYKEPHTVLMDEATSALDNETEARILRTLERVVQNRTLIMIAHRLSTVQRCRRIILIDAGRIVDSGTFAEIAERHKDFVYPDSSDAGPALDDVAGGTHG